MDKDLLISNRVREAIGHLAVRFAGEEHRGGVSAPVLGLDRNAKLAGVSRV